MVLATDLGLVRNLDFLNLNTDVLVFAIFGLKIRRLLSFHVSVDIVMNLRDVYVLKSILTVNNKLFFMAVEGGHCDALWQ